MTVRALLITLALFAATAVGCHHGDDDDHDHDRGRQWERYDRHVPRDDRYDRRDDRYDPRDDNYGRRPDRLGVDDRPGDQR